MPSTTQLRTYTVRAGLMDEWVQRWRDEVVPLRIQFGFQIRGAWVDRERHQFVWIMSYDGPESFADRNSAYWNSSGRIDMELDPDHYLLTTDIREVSVVR